MAITRDLDVAINDSRVNSVIDACLNSMFPIGCIVTFVNDIDPGTTIGGTWEEYAQGRCLVCIDVNDSNFNTLGKTGGEKTHALTTTEIPAHTHGSDWSSHTHAGVAHTHTLPAHTHTFGSHTHTGVSHAHSVASGHNHTIPSHTHTVAWCNYTSRNGTALATSDRFVSGTGNSVSEYQLTMPQYSIGNGYYYSQMTGTSTLVTSGTASAATSGAASTATTSALAAANVSSSMSAPSVSYADNAATTVTINANGSGTAHNNLMPYQTVRFWKRLS